MLRRLRSAHPDEVQKRRHDGREDDEPCGEGRLAQRDGDAEHDESQVHGRGRQAHDEHDVAGDLVVEVLVPGFGDEGKVHVLRVVRTAAHEREREEQGRRPDKPGEVALCREGNAREASM